MSSSTNNFQSPGTTGIRITRRSARNLGNSRESSTPTTSFAASKSKEIVELANKHSTYIEDEASIKKLTTKREQEAHERALSFVKNQLISARRDNWLYKPIKELIGYTPKF